MYVCIYIYIYREREIERERERDMHLPRQGPSRRDGGQQAARPGGPRDAQHRMQQAPELEIQK